MNKHSVYPYKNLYYSEARTEVASLAVMTANGRKMLEVNPMIAKAKKGTIIGTTRDAFAASS